MNVRTIGRFALLTLGCFVCVLVIILSGFRLGTLLTEQHDPRSLAPPSGRYVQAGDVEFFVQETGPATGRPIVLVHGTGAWSELWRQQMDALGEAGYHAYAIDVPPFGFSQRPTNFDYSTSTQGERIAAFMETLDLENVTLVGHSFGARATLEAQSRAKERVQSLILIDPALGLGQQETSGMLLAILTPTALRNALVSATVTNPNLSKKFLESLLYRTEAATPERVRMLQQPLRTRMLTEHVGYWLRALLTPEPGLVSKDQNYYRSIHIPVLLIWGDKDTTTPVEQSFALSELLPNDTLALLKDVGHIPYIEEPEATNRLIVSFMQSGTIA